jgi:hypothetical protein
LSRHRETGFVRLVGCQGEGMEEKWHGNDIIFPNIEMCLITLAGWFNKSLLKKIGTPALDASYNYLDKIIIKKL